MKLINTKIFLYMNKKILFVSRIIFQKYTVFSKISLPSFLNFLKITPFLKILKKCLNIKKTIKKFNCFLYNASVNTILLIYLYHHLS